MPSFAIALNWPKPSLTPPLFLVLSLYAVVSRFYQLGLFLNRSYLPLKLEGWVNPRIYVGARSFQLGTPQTPISAEWVYTALLNAA